MLSERELSRILGASLPTVSVKDIHWRVEESDENSILFYRIGEGEEARRLFRERLKNARFSLLVVNVPAPELPMNAIVIEERHWPRIQKDILDALYPQPQLQLIGITGTNGKTTTTDLVLQLGSLIGKKGISIGTLGVREVGKELKNFGLTSPSLIDLRKFLVTFGKGKDFCVMEASSHALFQERLFGIVFDCAGWLSFSQDHLDYHKSMEAYLEAKSLIYKHLRPGAKLFLPESQKDLYSKLSRFRETTFARKISTALPLFFTTEFNRDNLEVALAIIEELFGVQPTIDFHQLTSPDGRFYIRNVGESYLVVDFAHTPDALLNICRGIRKAFPEHRLKVLFGCGGDRDRSKRPLMGAVVDQWAEEAYVTSDNPRSEDPERIIDDVILGFSRIQPRKIIDRRDAVRSAFSELQGKEILLLAGKGHEDYILIQGVKHPYSDIQEVDDFVRRKTP